MNVYIISVIVWMLQNVLNFILIYEVMVATSLVSHVFR